MKKSSNKKITIKQKIKEKIELLKKDKVLTVVMVISIFFLCLLFVNNIFNHPNADDYSNYTTMMNWYNGQDLNIFNIIKISISKALNTYKTFQGTYFSDLLFTFSPMFISYNFYKIIMLLFQIFWLFSIKYFINSFSDNPRKSSTCKFFTYLFILYSILFSYALGEGFYWYTGVVLYLFPYSLSLIFLGLQIRYIKTNKKRYLYLFVLLSSLLGGTNYVTGLFVGFVYCLEVLYFILEKDKRHYLKQFIPCLILYGICFAFNVFCPGNFIRISAYERVSIPRVLLISIENAYNTLKYLFFKTLYIPFIIISLPYIKNIVKNSKINFKYSSFLIILCLLGFICFFAPMAYSFGNTYLDWRVQNLQLFYACIMITACIIGYCGKKYNKTKIDNYKYCGFGGGILCIIMISAIGAENITGIKLFEDLLYEKSLNYNICMNNIRNKLQKGKSPVKISNCEVFPSSLHTTYFEEDSWVKNAVENYYNKKIEIVNDNK